MALCTCTAEGYGTLYMYSRRIWHSVHVQQKDMALCTCTADRDDVDEFCSQLNGFHVQKYF